MKQESVEEKAEMVKARQARAALDKKIQDQKLEDAKILASQRKNDLAEEQKREK